MAIHGKGLICMPMSAEYIRKLKLPQMVADNTDNHETAFTVSIDSVETTTGISAAERSITAMRCVAEDAKPEDFRRPGHMFPLLAKRNGVLVSPAGEKKWRAGAGRAYRSYGRPVPAGGIERMRPLL